MFQWRDYAHAYRNQQIRYRSYKPYFNHRQQSVTIAALKKNEPIAGYTVIERIGAGGYGEVWKVEAPGGLEKAIKFVYGHLDETRADREMKALNRIKEVRHPFLLSLERIEVIDGQLIIVTELADASLKDLFDERRKLEERGIPRDKLLVYLGDAADALDYMSENYSLQHMDIKPENLLLVGGRVKVADFGLVKELQDVTVSLMGGLTPIYAPPEVFDGQPSRFSDQYSLAIVYQEMLTGCLPFPGTTVAQLATQHLSRPPQLSALPNADQAMIAKALSKNSDDRFESCRQLVDMLVSAGQATASPVIESDTNQKNKANRDTPTVERTAQPPAQPQQKQRLASKRKLPRRVATPEIRNSPPIEINLESVRLQPTVFVGLGGTAGQILLRLRSRLCERFGSTEKVPALRMVAIDTDAKALSCLTQSDSIAAFDPGDIVPTPLKQSHQYRQRSDKLTQSISRRWLYNIPRSLQTNGMRPLGRLALMDHSSEVDQRIRAALESVTSAEAIEATQETTGIQLSPEPRVVLISSISGGCGSGMVLDVAYMVRKVLGELGADKHRICGILAHSTPRNTDGKDLAIANAFACLSELQHYCRADHYYPGDPVCGLPPFTPDIAPFDDTYMVHLGDDLNEEQLQSASDWVAEYLYLDSVTAGKTVFQACRAAQDSEDASSESTQLRTMGLTQIGCSNAETVTAATELLCQRVIHRWHKLDQITPDPSKTESAIRPTTEVPLDESNRVTSPIDSLCSQQCQQLGLDFDVLVQSTQQIVDGQLGENLQDWLQQLLAPFANDKSADSSAVAALEAIDAKLGLRAAGQEQAGSSTSDFEEGLARLLNERAETLGKAICDWLWTLLDEPELRLTGVKSAVEWLTTHFASLSDKAQEVFDRHSRELHEISKSLDNGKRKQQPEDDRQLVMQYFQLGMTRTAIEQLEKISKPIEARIKALDGQLAELGRELNYAANHFSHIAADYQPFDDQSTSLQQALWHAMQAQLPELAVKLDRDFSEQFFGPHGGLRSLVDSDQNLRELLPQTLRHAARQALADARQQLRIVDALAAQGDASEARAQLGKCLEAATPKLLECGGSKRLVVVAPQHALSGDLRQWLEEGFDESLSVVPDSDSDIVFCYEVGGVSLAQVAATLIDDRLDYAEAASRLHTRNDVQWLPW